jgi:beta-glucanase (GH16 family)
MPITGRIPGSAIFILIVVVLALVAPAGAQTWSPLWSDEFSGSGAVSSSHWVLDVGGGYSASEQTYYQAGTANASQAGGVLTIQARKQIVGSWSYTSARLKTQGVRTFGPGDTSAKKIEARLSGPSGAGLWTALWMLGSNIPTTPWPGCGEIDIMDHINSVNTVYGTLHWTNDAGTSSSYTAAQPAMSSFGSMHTYAITWDANAITWSLDGANVGSANIAGGVNGTSELHQDFFMIMNLAVGGTWPGPPNSTTVFPANFNVDWVRYHEAVAAPTAPPRPTPTVTARSRPRPTPTSAPGGTLLSQGRPVAVSSTEHAGTAGGNAVDGNTGTRWSSAFSDPQWIRVDLGSTRNVARIVLRWETAYGRGYQLQSSNDAVNWSTFYSTTAGNGGIDDVAVTAAGRYIRMNGTARATQYGYSLWELQIYGN